MDYTPKKGDTVQIEFVGVVEVVEPDGRYAVKCDGGSYFYVNPAFGDAEVAVVDQPR